MLGIIRMLGFTGLLRLVIGLMMDRRVSLGLKLVIPAAIAYVISPLDLLHDFLPVLGRIDDIVVTIVALALFFGMAPREVVMEHVRGRRGGTGVEGKARHSDRKVIDGSYRYVDDDSESGR